MKYLLYCKSTTQTNIAPCPYKIEKIIPTLTDLRRGIVTRGELLWRFLSVNRFSLFVIRDESGAIIHKSARIGKCGKFSFLKKGEWEIGPCFTSPEHRGKGLYPAVLSYITNLETARYYMLVREDNVSSIRGIEKAGFSILGEVAKGRLGRWKIIDQL